MDDNKKPQADNAPDTRAETDLDVNPDQDFIVPDHDYPHSPVPSKFPLILSAFALLVAMGVAGATATLHLANQSEIIRLSNEVAQLRVSLDLYARGSAATSGADALKTLSERVERLEETASATAAPSTALPALEPPTAPAESAPTAAASANSDEQQGDCLPVGMRLLVAAGDVYPICGQAAKVDVSIVDSGYIALADGTVVPSGVGVPLPNSACSISVTSTGDEGITGFAEIRVTC